MTDIHSISQGKAPRHHKQLTHAVAIAIIILFTLPVLLIFLGTGDPTNSMELFNLIPVREAFRDGHWLMPTLNGWPRFEKPPLCVWIPAGLAALVGSDSLWVVRMPSVVMAVLTGLATYGIGCWIFRDGKEGQGNGRVFALLAGLMVPAMFAFDRHARLASYDIYATAFTVGCAFFVVWLAEGELGGGRAVMVWALAGLALGGGLLAKGPAPLATVMVPVLAWLGIYHRRRAVWWGVAGMIGVGVLVAAPWVLAVLARYPAAWDFWKAEAFKLFTSRTVTAPELVLDTKREWYYYLQIFFWVAPFVPLFVAGLWLPFAPEGGPRRGRWLGWMVVVGGLVLLSIPAVKELRYAVQILPFAALLCAGVAREFVGWRNGMVLQKRAVVLAVAQGLFLIVPAVVGIAVAAWMILGHGLPAWGLGIMAAFWAIGLGTAGGLSVGLLAGAIILWRSFVRGRIWGAVAAFAFCCWIFALGVEWGVRGDPQNRSNAWRGGLERMATTVGRAPVSGMWMADIPPWLSTLYYFNRPVRQVYAGGIAEMALKHPGEAVYVVVISPEKGEVAEAAEFQMQGALNLSGRKAELLQQFTEEGQSVKLFRLDVPVLLIDGTGKGR